VSCPSAS